MSEIPLYIEPRLCWRTWSVIEAGDIDQTSRPSGIWSISTPGDIDQTQDGAQDGRYLLMSGMGTIWPGHERLEAECHARRGCTQSPTLGCTCGIYAARSLEILRAMGYAAGPDDDFMPDLVGELWMWGRAVESENILRAEFAYPKRLFVPFRRWRWGKPLREYYGVPVEVRNPFTMFTEEE